MGTSAQSAGGDPTGHSSNGRCPPLARGAGRVKLAGMTPSSQTKRSSRLGATPERDPVNELYDQTCSLLEGA
jgi:hypothetical protein